MKNIQDYQLRWVDLKKRCLVGCGCVWSKIQGFGGKCFSKEGKEVLIKSVLQVCYGMFQDS